MKSWVESANGGQTHFPVQNLPFGCARLRDGAARCVTAIGDQVLDLPVLEENGVLETGANEPLFDTPGINKFMAAGKPVWETVRAGLIDLLQASGNNTLRGDKRLCGKAFHAMADVTLEMPFKVAEFTDFYAGMQHAKNMGEILRGSPELPANWLHIPVGYNGRASSVVVSGTDISRPLGQTKSTGLDEPVFGPSQRLDIELELGAVVGTGSQLGQPISVEQADEMIFGFVLLNDWSARDIQAFEYQPLGPFQGKAFATTISPWVVTSLALESFRQPVPKREKPQLDYLRETKPGLYDIQLEVTMRPPGATQATTLCRTNANRLYYSPAQQLCHHAIGGCKMNSGDLLGSGTISGPVPGEYGSLMELSQGGQKPFVLDSGETRSFIEDGDTLTLTGWAQAPDHKIGFGECTGTILPAPKFRP